jgi:hypothetical protein
MLNIAQRYYKLGFTPIPCEPKSKKPTCEWAQWHYRRPEWDELEAIWRDAFARFGNNLNIATLLGKAHGLCAVDIDNPKLFKQARQAIGLTENDLRTWTTLSHRGGALIFRYPNGYNLPSKTPNELWGSELLGNERILVLPPSIHPEGTPYRWLKGHKPVQIPLADIPEPLLFAFIGEQQKPTPRSVTLPQNGHGDGNELPAWAYAIIALLKPRWQKGWRHDTALALAGVFAKRGIPKETAEAILWELVRETGDNEAKDRLRALMDTYERLAEGESVLAWQGLERVLDEEILQALDRLLPNPPRKSDGDKRVIRLLTLSEWDERLAHISQGHWLVEELLQAGWLLVINARPKVGKSLVSVNLATALAEGTKFLGLSTSPCAVLYIDLERPLETLNRFKTLNAQDNPNIFVPSERIGADMLETLRELIRQAKERTNRDVVVFVDTLGDFIKPALRQRKASINDYDAIAEILQELRDLALELGCAFVFVHHTRKAQSEEPNEVDVLGSTAIAGKFDVIAHLQPNRTDGSVLTLTAEGNAIAKTTLHFTISDNYRLEVCEPPAKTKEEQAAREIRRLLKQHHEGLTRNEIVGYLQDIGLVDTVEGAQKLFSRSIQMLRLQVRREGRRTRYFLPQDEDDGGGDGHNGNDARRADEACRADNGQVGQDREFVQNVHCSQKAQQNKAKKNGHDCGHDDGTMSNVAGETLDTMDTMDNIPLSKMSKMSNVEGIVEANYGQPPEPMSNVVSIKKTQAGLAFSPIMDTMDKLYIASNVSNVGDIVEPSVTEPLPPTPNPTSSDEVRYVDTEKWLDELCAELSKASSKPDDNASLSSQQKPDRLACLCGGELRLFGKTYECLRCDSPRIAACRYCGKVLQLTSDSHAECVGCGLLYTFDRARRLWLSDLDAF